MSCIFVVTSKIFIFIMDKLNKEIIYHTVLKLEVNKGHLNWTMSDVSRLSGQKRTSLYYHFGKDLTNLLHASWDYMLNTIFVLKETKSLGIRKRLSLIVSEIKEKPYLFVLFYLEKTKESEVGFLIRQAEKQLLTNIKKLYPKYSDLDILKIYLCELGTIAYQDLTEDQLNYIFPK